MSVYSGFSTRNQESAYNKALFNLLFLFQLRALKATRNEQFDEDRFKNYFK